MEQFNDGQTWKTKFIYPAEYDIFIVYDPQVGLDQSQGGAYLKMDVTYQSSAQMNLAAMDTSEYHVVRRWQ